MSDISPFDQAANYSAIFAHNWHNPFEYFRRFIFIHNLLVSLTMTVYCFGALSNILIILVFWKDGFRSTSNISFFALAVADFLISTIWAVNLVSNHIDLRKPSDPVQNYIAIYVFPCAEAIYAIGSWITAIITWERLICIVYPLTVKLIFTRKLIICLINGAVVYEVAVMTTYFVGDYVRMNGYDEENVFIVYWKDGLHLTPYNITETAREDTTFVDEMVMVADLHQEDEVEDKGASNEDKNRHVSAKRRGKYHNMRPALWLAVRHSLRDREVGFDPRPSQTKDFKIGISS
ncbi:chemosensory receptor A [Elysia marginata]|uniref:Chemosensory receptor A n=1 Tax=Elysia marginata TaxID=1093978 RepID=A0AAV4IPD6_9GAST|nr:chemosensory receptor A [Elysia marginata]